VVLLSFEYVMPAPPGATAGAEGVNGEVIVEIAVTGAHVTVWGARDTVKVTSVAPARCVGLAAAPARTTQFPVPLSVNTPVDASTTHVDVVLLTNEYEITPPPLVVAPTDGVRGEDTAVVAVTGAHVTVGITFSCRPVTAAVPFAYPARLEVTVTVEDARADNPVRVTTDPLTLTEPAEARAVQVNKAS
jgi:hypothetical protein